LKVVTPNPAGIGQCTRDILFDLFSKIGDIRISEIGTRKFAYVKPQFIFHHTEAGECELIVDMRTPNEELPTPTFICQKFRKGGVERTDHGRGVSSPTKQSTHGFDDGINVDLPQALVSEMTPHGGEGRQRERLCCIDYLCHNRPESIETNGTLRKSFVKDRLQSQPIHAVEERNMGVFIASHNGVKTLLHC
jgi:hypothetical protein